MPTPHIYSYLYMSKEFNIHFYNLPIQLTPLDWLPSSTHSSSSSSYPSLPYPPTFTPTHIVTSMWWAVSLVLYASSRQVRPMHAPVIGWKPCPVNIQSVLMFGGHKSWCFSRLGPVTLAGNGDVTCTLSSPALYWLSSPALYWLSSPALYSCPAHFKKNCQPNSDCSHWCCWKSWLYHPQLITCGARDSCDTM